MKNFNLQVSQNRLYEDTFFISRANHSYAFFSTEYRSLPLDSEGNILLRFPSEKGTNFFNKILNSIKDYILNDDKSVGIPVGSEEYSYFQSEFNSRFPEDIHHNLIISEEEYPKVKTKKN